MTDKQEGILWRIARLHPGWITLIVWVGYLCIGGYGETVYDNPPVAVAWFTGYMLLYMSYPLFVLLFLSGRFRTWLPPRPGRALLAFIAIEILIVAVILVGPDTLKAVMEDAPNPAVQLSVPLIAEAGFGDSWAESH